MPIRGGTDSGIFGGGGGNVSRGGGRWKMQTLIIRPPLSGRSYDWKEETYFCIIKEIFISDLIFISINIQILPIFCLIHEILKWRLHWKSCCSLPLKHNF